MIDKFISCMKEQGWTVERNEKQRFCLPEPMKSRYTGYPESWVEFVSIVKSMIRGDEGAWFLCSEDYDVQGNGNNPFHSLRYPCVRGSMTFPPFPAYR